MTTCDMRVQLPGLRMKNPIVTASGTFGMGQDYLDLYPLSVLGAMTTKAITLAPRAGNPMPRIAETPAGMLNAIGLMNPGVDALGDALEKLEQEDVAVLANIAGSTEEEYVETARRVSRMKGVDALEVNISCPNVRHGGMAFGTDPKLVERLTYLIRAASAVPVYMKLSPNVTDITELARAAEAGGADGLTLINTLLGMRLDLRTGRPILANGTGGLSGPAIKPVAVRMVYQVYRAVHLPLIGMGGISSAEDVLEFLYAGARAVSIGTAQFADPMLCPRLVEELPVLLEQHGFDSVREAVGFAHRD